MTPEEEKKALLLMASIGTSIGISAEEIPKAISILATLGSKIPENRSDRDVRNQEGI